MNLHDILKIFFVFEFCVFIFIWSRSFILNGLNKNAFYTLYEGILGAILLRLFLTLSFIAIVFHVFFQSNIPWSYFHLSIYIRIIGVLIGFLSICLLVWVLRNLGSNFSASLNIKERHRLIINGPYKYSRHPMYVSLLLLWLSFFLLTSNWFIAITGISAYIVIFISRVPREEKMLLNYFGREYKIYCEKTRRFIGFSKK